MKKYKPFVLLIVFCFISYNNVNAQEWYDLTSNYLVNADFSTDVNYDVNATDKVSTEVKNIVGWTSLYDPESAVSGATFQYGTQATFYSTAIPTTGPNEISDGGCLVMAASLKSSIIYYQSIKLPQGNYQFIISSQNLNTKSQQGSSPSGWWASESDNTLCSRDSFPNDEWVNDTIRFSLNELTKGRLQVGLTSVGGTVRKSAYLAIDHVQLLRDTPYGEQDDLALTPEVITDTRFARGATMAFGRIADVKGEGISETGFCWATHPEPTYANDNHTTQYLNNNGKIYWMKGLEPATIYYMRAYALTKNGAVGYGEEIKFSTVPKGRVTYWYNNGGDEAANKRVNDAATNACEIFNDLTSIVKHFNIGYSSGTPTADCYYADEPWMNMGSNSSYQRTGTIMHEMQHGMGVIPYTTQWSKNILRERLDGEGRGTGHWLGDRVSEFLDFWDNTTGSQLNGDYQHMWPYGINGANEDNGTNVLYFANALIGQALGEDGLEHRSNTFAEPCYIFTQDDNVKYYLTCEAENRGLYTSYLSADETGKIMWSNVSAADVLNDDHAAWYITFNPAKQYYQLRNAATDQYLTYTSSGFKTVSRNAPTANDNLHLMKGRIDVNAEGQPARRGYWIIHPTNNLSPISMQATGTGTTSPITFNLANSAKQQRWVILTGKDLGQGEESGISATLMNNERVNNNHIYDLQGRKINNQYLRKGIYIINGKKVVK